MKATPLLLALPIALAAGCGDDGVDTAQPDSGVGGPDASMDACAVPAWAAPDFDDNAADTLALRGQLAALKGTMEDAEVQGTVARGDLDELYAAGDPSLADVTTEGYDAIIDKTLSDFVLLVPHQSGAPLTDGDGNWTGGESDEGGVYNERGLDGAGMEPVQLLEKGLFSAAQYNHALGLTEGDITPATVDALAAAWGTDAALDPEAADDSAGYSHDMGFHAGIAQALTEAKAYAADGECEAELNAAIERFFRDWELALMARAVYYANAGRDGIQAAQDDAELADGLHGLAEGIGLAIGFYGMPDPEAGPLSGAGRVITDADIEAMMTELGFDNETAGTLNGSTTAETFVDDGAAADDAVSGLEGVIMEAYGLEQADIEDYRDPTAG